MQAIVTKYYGPTNTRGSKVKAITDAGSVTISGDSSLNAADLHRAAAEALAEKLGWVGDYYGELVQGWLPDTVRGFAYVFTFTNSKS
jgi:hypothetical protein